MAMIRPNCRIQITSADLDFILAALMPHPSKRKSFTQLVANPNALDEILDDQALFSAILEQQDCLSISKHFYFYVLVRHVLRESDIHSREVADYVASMLSSFSVAGRSRQPLDQTEPMDYLVDMLAALQDANAQTRFMIRVHLGNHSLYLAGVFPGHIRYRSQHRAAPNIHYYEEVGSTNFRLASGHKLAQQHELAPIFATLAESFHRTRKALNDMAERLLFLDELSHPTHLLLPEEDV